MGEPESGYECVFVGYRTMPRRMNVESSHRWWQTSKFLTGDEIDTQIPAYILMMIYCVSYKTQTGNCRPVGVDRMKCRMPIILN